MRFFCSICLAVALVAMASCSKKDSPTSPGDSTGPAIVSISPAGAAVRVPVTALIVMSFSEAIQPATVTPLTIVIDHGVTGSFSFSSGNKTVTFTPSAALYYSTEYTVTVTTGVKDQAGNALTDPQSFSFTTQGNTWVKVFDWGSAIGGKAVAASNGQIVVACGRVVKLDSLGNVLWDRTDLSAVDIARVAGGSGYVALVGPNGMGLPTKLVALDENGQTQWESVLSAPAYPWHLAGNSWNNGYYVMCTSNDSGCTWVQKYSTTGQIVWQRQFFGYGKFFGRSIHTMSGGDLLIGGVTEIESVGEAKYAVQIEPTAGSVIWDLDFTSYMSVMVYQVTTDLGGAILFVGQDLPDFSSTRASFERRDRSGAAQMFNEAYTFSHGAYAAGVVQTSDAGYLLVGTTDMTSGEHLFVLKTDYNGAEEWRRILQGNGLPGSVHAHSIEKAADGGYILVGTNPLNFTDVGLVVAKTDGEGYF